MKDETDPLFAVVHGHADHIRWQQVAGELNPAENGKPSDIEIACASVVLPDAGKRLRSADGPPARRQVRLWADLQILADDD